MGNADKTAKILDIPLDEELSRSYGRYAQTIILDRAIPDARDGLKPVQRRILYAMAMSKNTPDKQYRKCAKTVGDVMGNYHPHGDQSIYAALVRLAQSWKMRLPLVDGHGNFGSNDDDPPAAMRYTEARLAGASMELLRDIERDTVAFRPNFDETTLEPSVLPAAYPNLLVNGTSGVSTGFATEIPPHNLREVVEAVCMRLDSPDVSLDEVMKVVPGPDFPTGGILMGAEDLRAAYETGRGRVTVRSRHRIEKEGSKSLIVVDELPYGVVKANLVRDLEQLHQTRAVQGISDVRDESDREGMRVVIELSRNADVEGVWNFVCKKTSLQVYYNFNMVAIHHHRPVEFGLLGLLDAYIEHRREVFRRRCEYDLARAQERIHIVAGLIKAVDILDEVIATIRGSKDRADARHNLIERFEFTEAQADAILELRLHRLTGLQIIALREEFDALSAEIAKLEKLLGSQRRMDTAIKRELRVVAKEFGDDRRTEVRAEVETLQVALEVRVKPQPTIVVVTDRGYIKRSSVASYQASGADRDAAGVVEGDFPRFCLETNTTHRVLAFSAKGSVFSIPAHSIPEAKWSDTGSALVNVVPFDMQDDKVVGLFAYDHFPKDTALVFYTQRGFVKRTMATEFDLRRSGGVVAMKVQGGDRLRGVLAAPPGADVMLATRRGQSIRFPIAQVSVQGRSAKGVRGMGVLADDEIVDATVLAEGARSEADVVVVTEAGKAKRTPAEGFPRQHRGGKGVRAIVHRSKRPHLIAAISVAASEEDAYRVYRLDDPPVTLPASSIRTTRRDGNGFGVAELGESGSVRAVIRMPAAPPEGEEPAIDAEDEDPVEVAPPVIKEVSPPPSRPASQMSLIPGGPSEDEGAEEA